MDASNFQFLQPEWPELYASARKAEALAAADARTSCFYARRALEATVQWMYTHDAALKVPYQDHLAALLHEPTFRAQVGDAIFVKARLIKDLGNLAVHSSKPVRPLDALAAARELFHVLYWVARTYGRGPAPAANLAFNPELLPRTAPVPAQTARQLQELESQLRQRDEKLAELLNAKVSLDEELVCLRAEIAEAKKANAAKPDTHDYSEAETRDYFIDLLLKESGWALTQPGHDTEFPVQGMPNKTGEGFVDYVLWGDDGKPLAIVEAKRTRRDAKAGQQQAKLYADCLEKQFGIRPVIFCSNGYQHWLWDDAMYPPRGVHGFYKKDELELMIQRRASRKPLAEAAINEEIVERYYQTRAIRRIGEALEKDNFRKSLVVMATGAGKTRTVIALCDLLMRCNWIKRVLFLADRTALVTQALNAFKKHLPDSSPVNAITEREKIDDGRVIISTYPTMMNLIEEAKSDQRRFSVGHFDLVIIDEAHRSVYQKYRAIFEYFDSFLVGLTATPKDEVDRDTYRLFDLEKGVPTDAYGLEDAVKDGFLVPFRAVDITLKFQRDGISYDDLSEEEKEQWEEKEWDEDGHVPDHVEAQAVNKWLFNEDTVDKVLEYLMTQGIKVTGGDRLGKTIVFAKNHAHAEFIAERFNKNYPHYKGEFARVIDFSVDYAQTLINNFSLEKNAPHIAISVDMLDTGIDVPEAVNLVFFKLVRSKTKFWQMVGRGTRLRPDLFGPGKDKQCFYIFDFCQNLEFFSQNPEATDGAVGESLSKRLFKARLELIALLDAKARDPLLVHAVPVVREPGADYGEGLTEEAVRQDTANLLRREVEAMNVSNFVVRPRRALVEKYGKPEAWDELNDAALAELSRDVAGLPNELDPEDEEAKRFDLLMLRLQLALLRSEPGFPRLRKQLEAIAGLLEEKSAIPMIQQHLALIQSVQADEWWQDVTTPMLERARRCLRALMKLIEKQQRKPIYTDFEDEMGEGSEIVFGQFLGPDSFERFREKARQFFIAHELKPAVQKLKSNQPLTPADLAELERMLNESGVGTPDDWRKATEQSHGLGLFIRSLIGLDRGAAKQAFAGFLASKPLKANQIEFLDLVINYLTEHGIVEPTILYQSPYTDLHAKGPDGLFTSADVDQLFGVLAEIRSRAAA